MNLYADTLSFRKEAMEVALSEDPNSWSMEILQELYKQAPFISDFQPDITMDKVDGERGYGLGYAVVSNKTDMPRADSTPQTRQAVGIKQVRIPIVVKDGSLLPLDVMMADGKTVPLTETRLRRALFRPQPFDVTGTGPGDSSMMSQLFPPQRFMNGFGSGGFSFSKEGQDLATKLQKVLGLSEEEMTRLKSKSPPGPEIPLKQASLLAAVLDGAPASRYAKVASAFDDPRVRWAYANRNAVTGPALDTLIRYEEKAASARPASVVQVRVEGERYAVKSASHHGWEPSTVHVDRAEIVRHFGAKVALDVDTAGSVTMVEGEASPEEETGPEASKPRVIDSFGLYKVREASGRELVGYVVMNPYGLDGVASPVAVFSNGSEATVQPSIAGLPAGKSAELPTGDPFGHGLFYRVLSNGSVEGTVPMTIGGSSQVEGGQAQFLATSYDGEQGSVSLQPNLKTPVAVDGALLLPDDMKWMPLGEAKAVALASTPEEYDAQKTAMRTRIELAVRPLGGDLFYLTGRPVEKVAADGETDLDGLLFVLGGLGLNLNDSLRKVAAAQLAGRPATFVVSRVLEPALEKRAAPEEPPFDLVKEAAFLPDPMSVDSVLSLGFLTPDNVKTFISHLPQLEQTQTKLCEMLLAVRIGMADVPGEALEKTVQCLESVIEGLDVLRFSPPS